MLVGVIFPQLFLGSCGAFLLTERLIEGGNCCMRDLFRSFDINGGATTVTVY